VVADLAQLLKPVGRQNDVRPAALRLNFLRQRSELLIRVVTTRQMPPQWIDSKFQQLL
jgi:hypothetical protein